MDQKNTPPKLTQPAVTPARSTRSLPQLPSAFNLFMPCVRAVTRNLAAFLWLAGIPLVILAVAAIMKGSVGTPKHSSGAFLGLEAAGVLLSLLLGPGLILLKLKAVRIQPVTAASAFRAGLPLVWRYFLMSLLIGCIAVISFMLLIVPFFLVIPRLTLVPYFLVDQNMGIFDSIRASNEAYKKYRGIWGLIGVSILLALPALIPVVGSVVTLVLEFLYGPAFALRYEQLKLMDQGKVPLTAIEAELLAV